MKRIIIIGAGGHHKVIKEIIQQSADHEVAAVIDDKFDVVVEKTGVTYAPFSSLGQILRSEYSVSVIVAIGSNEVRRKIVEDLEEQKVTFATIIHPSAIVSP